MPGFEERVKTDNEAREYADRSRGENLLLSASAGCGKTFTLVKRIVNRAMEEGGISIDRLLVVTFTRAAASELKSKIEEAFEKRAAEEFENGRLEAAEKAEEQRLLVSKAAIGTLDFFTGDVVKKHFTKIGIDPQFDIDPVAVKIITQEVIGSVLEEYYGAPKDSKEYKIVRELVDVACGIASDDEFKFDIIEKIVDYCDNLTDPIEWLGDIVKKYDDEKLWYDFFVQQMRTLFEDGLEQLEECRKILADPKLNFENSVGFENCFNEDERLLKEQLYMLDQEDGLFRLTLGAEYWAKIPSKKGTDEEKMAHDVLKGAAQYRTQSASSLGVITKVFEKLLGGFTKESFCESIKKMKAYAEVLSEIVQKVYTERLEKCIEKNVYDFSQIAHFALDVLKNEEVAKSYRAQYDEIYIDEYQDTNQIQEAIMTCVSRISEGEQNMFMVGDVKQSIYGFRQATPEFFMAKYKRFNENPMDGKLKILSKNFRSRNQILEGTNVIFNRIMTEKTAGISYKDGHDLLFGAANKYGELEKEQSKVNKCEFIYGSGNKNQAALVAKQIKRLFDQGFTIKHKEKDGYVDKKITYGDICILARRNATLGEMKKALSSLGIPVVSGTNENLFDKFEVQNLLSFVKIVNNPYDDISLCTCLRSKYGNLTNNELALLRLAGGKNTDFWTCISNICSGNFNYKEDSQRFSALLEKINAFCEKLVAFQQRSNLVNLSELVWEIANLNDYYTKVSDEAKENLRKFVDISAGFDSGVKGGLGSFVRYIDSVIQLDKKYNTSTFAAASGGDAGDAVNFMTVHGSKGLEFPVVILVDANKPPVANRDKIIIDNDYGFGLNFIDYSSDIGALGKSAPMRVLLRKLENKDREESERSLYVALTRATEKLIVTADSAAFIENSLLWDRPAVPTAIGIKTADTYAKMMQFGMLTEDGKEFWDVYQGDDSTEDLDDISFAEFITGYDKEAGEFCDGKLEESNCRDEIMSFEEFALKVEEATKGDEGRIPSKLSVSSLKKMADDENSDDMETYQTQVVLKSLDEITKDTDGIKKSGTGFGTIMHKAMELLIKERNDFPSDEKAFDNFINTLINKWKFQGYFKESESKIIDKDMLVRFLGSELALEVKSAGENLRTETPFTVFVDIGKYVKSYSGIANNVAIQGVIDLYYLVDGKLKIVDFKTDHVDKNGSYKYIDSYKMQLDCYKNGLEKITGEKVSDCVLYFLRNGNEIAL